MRGASSPQPHEDPVVVGGDGPHHVQGDSSQGDGEKPNRSAPRGCGDEYILELVKAGQKDRALSHLMADYGHHVYLLCSRTLRDPELAEDARQQVFLQAYRDIEKFEPRASLRTWLSSIATHRCMDALRQQRRNSLRYSALSGEALEVLESSPSPDEQASDRQLYRVLDDCLHRLSPDTRYVVLLRYQLGLSFEEIASAVGGTASSIQMRVARSVQTLRREIERRIGK